MKDFKIGADGDLVLNDVTSDLTLTDDPLTLLKQQIQSLLNTNIGELSWNDSYGLNMADVMVNSDDVNAVQQIVDSYLRDNLPGYASIAIESSNFDQASRNLYIQFSITMDDGTTVDASIGGEA